ncbi:MAG TPA: PD-(D/E)XK nuclease family protein [Caldimonas sp.]|nr:PD-(D/E)XK nuclease family protein [Caldimonas sp.]
MATIARAALEAGAEDDPWTQAVCLARSWAQDQHLELRDAIVLVPFAQHLPLARRAWARQGGWMPRIETTQTLAASLGPPEAAGPEQLTFETALDRLSARRLLSERSWAQAWARRDPRGYDHALGALVRLAQGLARAASAWRPGERPVRWNRARAIVSGGAGPGDLERLLARVAVEWAAAASTLVVDRLERLAPSGWIAVRAGGDDELTMRLLDGEVPGLVIDADLPLGRGRASVSVGVCRDFEDEARRTAAEVIAALGQGVRPIALIAADRVLVRRVRALLARAEVPILDETGWKLSTTRAGAQVAGLLKAARADASCDDRLDWLKGLGAWPGDGGSDVALEALESVLRRRAWHRPEAVDVGALPEAAADVWVAAQRVLDALRTPRVRSLSAWLAGTTVALDACGALAALRADEAGVQVLEALRLVGPALAFDDVLDFDEYTAWVDAVLEEGTFRPPPPTDAAVVVTPLERAVLRPFAAAVLAGADEKRLGVMPAPWPLVDERIAEALGLPTREAQRMRETAAFAHLLRASEVVILRRADDGGEPLGPSPLIERLELARLAQGMGAPREARDATTARAIASAPTTRPAPRPGQRLPPRLSASACEALRACPYRFHALYVLGLREIEELDDGVEKRDYGTWLHAVLHRFHAARAQPEDAAVETARLHAAARDVQAEMHLEDEAFLPYAASFEAFVPRYVEWLHGRDREGARWLTGEQALESEPATWAGVAMQGRIDRIDVLPDGTTQLIDYKTGSAEALRRKAVDRLEDTQLAFYAALVAARDREDARIAAGYLPLDERDRLRIVSHEDVADSARALVEGIGAELARVRAGAPLPALGEGSACTWCAARGLCRRDDWPVPEAAT